VGAAGWKKRFNGKLKTEAVKMSTRMEVRRSVWEALRRVARPDSRFHLDFSEFIPDFDGSDVALQLLADLDCYRHARTAFITPDNCLESLRARAIRDGKTVIMTTYGIRRGFVELRPEDVPSGLEDYVVLLDLIEQFGREISLEDLRRRYRLDLLVTGASAVTTSGVRFGKGHGFFDLEWAMLYQIGVVDVDTPIVAFVHDVQVVDLELDASPFDSTCDFIVTPTRLIHVENPQKPVTGVMWEKLEPGMLEKISSLAELKQLIEAGSLA
jgi:5-formyltetrahydrofolate cyclo-ligase